MKLTIILIAIGFTAFAQDSVRTNNHVVKRLFYYSNDTTISGYLYSDGTYTVQGDTALFLKYIIPHAVRYYTKPNEQESH